MDIGIHIYDVDNIPKRLRKDPRPHWHVYYPDEIKTHATVAALQYQLKSKNLTVYGNQEWPHVWATHTVNQLRYSIQVNPTPQCHFTVLNRKPRNHRIDIMNQLDNHQLLQYNYYSWLNTQIGDLPYSSKNHCTFAPNELDNNVEDEDDMWNVPSIAFGDSAASVVIESNENNLFVTEKTFIPLYQMRLPLVYGAPGLYEKLKEWGFEFPKEIDLQALCPSKDVARHLRRQSFADEIRNITHAHSPAELVELYKPYAQKNKQTLIELALNIPQSYYKWKRIVHTKWAKTSEFFMQQVEGPPRIGYKY